MIWLSSSIFYLEPVTNDNEQFVFPFLNYVGTVMLTFSGTPGDVDAGLVHRKD